MIKLFVHIERSVFIDAFSVVQKSCSSLEIGPIPSRRPGSGKPPCDSDCPSPADRLQLHARPEPYPVRAGHFSGPVSCFREQHFIPVTSSQRNPDVLSDARGSTSKGHLQIRGLRTGGVRALWGHMGKH